MLSKHAWDENIVPKDQWDELYVLRASITTESWDGITKNVFWHRIMSDIKLLVTQHEPDFINAWVMQQVQKRSNNAVVFVDIREPENIESFRQYVGNNYKDVLVKALYIESDVTEDFDNYSDGSVLNYSYDIRVKNPRKIFADELEASKNIHKEALSFIKDYVL
ncbi:hypothetical protein HYW61_01510 [candidate division WWE3 bacterium]|nr:hypothetical protein [candidate division WWE3 bacterium]